MAEFSSRPTGGAAGPGKRVRRVAGLVELSVRRPLCDSLGENLLQGLCEYRVDPVVLAGVENHPHLVETVLLSLQELDNRPERDRCGQPERINERPGGNGRERNAVQAVTNGDLQAASVGARQ